MKTTLAWRRAAVDRSPAYAGRRKVWPSACGRYRVVWRDEAYGVALTPEYHAMIRGEPERPAWHLLSRHRRKHAAQAACERHARQAAGEQLKPQSAPARRQKRKRGP